MVYIVHVSGYVLVQGSTLIGEVGMVRCDWVDYGEVSCNLIYGDVLCGKIW